MDLRAKITDAVYDHPRADDQINAVMGVVSAHVDTMAAVVEQQRQRIKELEADLERRRDSIAARIVEEEQRCQEAITADPTNPHLSGHLAGLQRARDIVQRPDGR